MKRNNVQASTEQLPPVTLACLIVMGKAPNYTRCCEWEDKLSEAEREEESAVWLAAKTTAMEKDFAAYNSAAK